jgi:hypothetical protein
MILVTAQDNARSMLQTQATQLTTIGTTTYYVLDGQVWAIINDTVFRSDEDTESRCVIQLCREINRLKG